MCNSRSFQNIHATGTQHTEVESSVDTVVRDVQSVVSARATLARVLKGPSQRGNMLREPTCTALIVKY